MYLLSQQQTSDQNRLVKYHSKQKVPNHHIVSPVYKLAPVRSRTMQPMHARHAALLYRMQATPEGIKAVQQQHAAAGGQARLDAISVYVSLSHLGSTAGQVT